MIKLSRVEIGLSMLFLLGEPFSSLMKSLREVDARYVEIADEGLHMLNSRRTKALKRVARSLGLELTLHAPFADINIASPSPSFRRAVLKRLEKSISCARQLDCQLWVFHPGLQTGVSPFYPGLDWRLNLDSIRTLLRVARKYEVKIAVENVPEPHPFLMKSVQDFSRFYKELGKDIGLVFDIGHANLNRQIHDFITRFSDKIVHMHASDNNGTIDSHLGIVYGTIDWTGVARAIKGINYDGVIIVESVKNVGESVQNLRKLFA